MGDGNDDDDGAALAGDKNPEQTWKFEDLMVLSSSRFICNQRDQSY